MNLSTRNYETAGFIEWSAGWNARVTWGIETVGPFRKNRWSCMTNPCAFQVSIRDCRKKKKEASK
jgi:hypothetical protein